MRKSLGEVRLELFKKHVLVTGLALVHVGVTPSWNKEDVDNKSITAVG